MDREADFFELFDEQRNQPCVDLLMRAKYNRRLGKTHRLFDRLRTSEPRGELQLTVKRRSGGPSTASKKHKQGVTNAKRP